MMGLSSKRKERFIVIVEWSALNPVVSFANYLPCEPGFSYGPRILRDHQWIYVVQGRGRGRIDDRPITLETGDLVYYGPGVAHWFEVDPRDPFTLYGMHVNLDGDAGTAHAPPVTFAVAADYRSGGGNVLLFGPDSEAEMRMPEHLRVSDTPIPALFAEIVNVYLRNSEMTPIINRGLLLHFFYEIFRHLHLTARADHPHRYLLRRLQTHLEQAAEAAYDRSWIREWTGYNEDYISRLFREAYGLSPHQYHMRHKIELAKELLAMTPITVTDLAAKLHFQSLHYFSRAFKARTGMSPMEYRSSRKAF